MSFLSLYSNGQDYHYWTDQFGIKATALGGAAISGLDDHSMVYYNAAAMTLVKNPSLSFSINAYQYRTFKQKDALGPNQNLESSDFSTIPNMMTGIFTPKKFPKWHLGYSVLSKNGFNNKLDLFHSGRYDVIDLPGEENFVSSFAQEIHNGEYWAGIGISYDATPHLSFGLTHMGVYKSTKYYNNYSISVLPADTSSSEVTQFNSTISFNYWNVKAIFKPSILLHYPKFRVGFVATLPSLNILGKGNFFREISTLNMDDVLPFDLTVTSRATKSKVKHRNPTSFSLGVSAQLGQKLWVHLTAETFLKQSYYLIHKDPTNAQHYPDFINDSLITVIFGNQKFLSYGEEYKAVTNFGLGIDIQATEQLGIQLGGRTDFNYNTFSNYEFARQIIQITSYDRLISSIGGNLTLKSGKRIALAFEFGFAIPKTTDYLVDFTTPNESRNGLTGDPGTGVKTSAYSYRVMFELTLGKLGK